MTNRRDFLKAAAVAGLAAGPLVPVVAASPVTQPESVDDRSYWLSVLERIARPVLENLAAGTLRKNMPVESSGKDRAKYTHLEAVGRTLCGIGPWLTLETGEGGERALRQELRKLVATGVDRATDPGSADYLNFFEGGGQPLVDAAFLAQAIVRAKEFLWTPLDARVRGQLVAALKASRKIEAPAKNNWVMFAAMVETALLELGETPMHERLQVEIQRMVDWYKGDGAYGDGPAFHWDYYNSFVIQPMLVDCLGVLARHDARYGEALAAVMKRSQRYAEIEERLIAPDGTFPSIGRSTTYRFGAFQTLGQMALLKKLPTKLAGGQVRSAMTAVIRRTMEAPGTFDETGWLRVGLCGHQPALGETYISTGSMYLCAAGLLPLGLPAEDGFWRDAAMRWTSQRLWSGENLAGDHALEDAAGIRLPG